MQRVLFVLAAAVVAGAISSTGCRSCSSCHDYSPPVAGGCEACGTHRAGSASGGYFPGPVYVEGDMVETGQ